MQLQQVADELGASARVVAIGTDSPETAADLAADLGLEFPLISDPRATVATSLGVVHPEPFGRGPVPYPTTLVLDAQGRGGASDFSMDVSVPPGNFFAALLQWDDPFGASGNDYNLAILNASETKNLCSLCSSTEPQVGNEDPFEAVCYYNTTINTVIGKVVIEKFSGSNKHLELFLFGAPPQYNDPAGSIVGHAGLPGIISVGAIDASDPGTNDIEPFSSRGPAIIRVPSFQSHAKPDITAVDGVAVTGAGGFPSLFFGTSASAPHIAGIAALLLETVPGASPSEIRDIIMQSAIDLGAAGHDLTYGAGLADAVAAADLVSSDGDGDGIRDPFDNCLVLQNNDQTNTDGDALGNVCDGDDDNDGIPDAYEIANNLDPLVFADGAEDADGDGLTSFEEFEQGRHPTVNEAAVLVAVFHRLLNGPF